MQGLLSPVRIALLLSEDSHEREVTYPVDAGWSSEVLLGRRYQTRLAHSQSVLLPCGATSRSFCADLCRAVLRRSRNTGLLRIHAGCDADSQRSRCCRRSGLPNLDDLVSMPRYSSQQH